MTTLTKTPEATSKARVLSAQEEAIHKGPDTLFFA
jgi:hypothetical protein